jgi:peptide/nickel transport system substrate-binding protein
MTLVHGRIARLATLFASAAIVVAACSPAASTAPTNAPTGAATSAPTTGASSAPFTATSYPADADAACDDATKNASEFKRIKAIDATHVEFDLCQADVAFLAKIAFASNQIQDSDWLTAHAPDKSILQNGNGTGPYMVDNWDHGNRLVLKANPNYWGTAPLVPGVEFRWSDQSVTRTQELTAGTVDGIDNPGSEDIKGIQGNSDLKFYQREGLSTLYLGWNVSKKPWDNVKVRQAFAEAIDYKTLVDKYYPPGSSVADHFTPCAIPFGCEGDAWYTYNPSHAKQLLTEAGFADGFKTTLSFRTAVRGYLPDPPTIATAIAAMLKQNLNVTATLDIQESGTMLTHAANWDFPGLYLLGWGADFPDTVNFLDYHFGSGAGNKFGPTFDDIVAVLKKGATSSADADRKAAYTEANNLIKQHIPMVPIVHGGSGTAFKADVQGAFASPIGSEVFSVMKPGDRSTLVWMQNAEPLSLYCGDESDGETLRACEQIFESLYAYKVGGTDPVPSLAKECTPNADLTVWTCTLQEGVKFAQGGTLDANDVVLSYAVQWDAKHALHVGNKGDFEYFPGLFGGFLNPPAS